MSQAPGGKAARERRHLRRVDTATAAPLTFTLAACRAHPRSPEVWVTCAHGKLVTETRLVDTPDRAGEAICAECQKMVDAGTPYLAQLRLACGACIRAHFALPPETRP